MKHESRKKIAHVTFDMHIGGAEQVILNLVENTDPSRYQVSVLCLEQPLGPFGVRLRDKGYRVETLTRDPGLDLSLAKKIRVHVRERGIDLLHCHQYTPYVYGLLGAASTRCRVVFTEHGRFHPDIRKPKRVVLNPFLSLLTHGITAISSATRDALVMFENFPRKKIRVVYNGIDDARYRLPPDPNLKSALGIPEKASVLGTVARLDPIKNQKMMVRALKIVRQTHPDTFLLVVGDGPEREALDTFVRDMGLRSHVVFAGFREDTHLCYQIMDLFLLTSFSEGTAMTLLEAMACGLPCVATDVGGNPEIVRDRETGFLVPSDDELALARRICLLFGDPGLSRRMGEAGRRRFRENFTVEKMAQQYQDLYEGKI